MLFKLIEMKKCQTEGSKASGFRYKCVFKSMFIGYSFILFTRINYEHSSIVQKIFKKMAKYVRIYLMTKCRSRFSFVNI